MRSPITRLAAALLTALVFTACVGRPDEEMQQAKGAVEKARTAGAEVYAPSQYAAAIAALRSAEQAVQRRDYRQALALAIDSRERARDATRIAAEQSEVARADATRRLHELEAAVEDARRRVASLERPGGTKTHAERLALSETRRAIVVANVSLQKARTAIVDGDYGAARGATEGVADHLKAIAEAKPASTPITPPRKPR